MPFTNHYIRLLTSPTPELIHQSVQCQDKGGNPNDVVYGVHLMGNPSTCFKSPEWHFRDRYCIWDLDKNPLWDCLGFHPWPLALHRETPTVSAE